MKPSCTFLTLGTLAFTLGMSPAAKATEELGLSFELKPINDGDTATQTSTEIARATTAAPKSAAPDSAPSGTSAPADTPASAEDAAPLPVPPAAFYPPVASDTALPTGVYGGGQALALRDRNTPDQRPLPAPPPIKTPVTAPSKQPASTFSAATSPSQTTTPSPLSAEPIDEILLGFDLEVPPQIIPTTSMVTPQPAQEPVATIDTAEVVTRLFAGGTESLVARAVGSAEGTRTPEGHKTPAYFGHVDPGNGVWNLGTFSYQHQAKTPEEADARQLNRLRSQTLSLKQKAQANGVDLSLEELLNGIDLANQAPMAALDRGGYVEWLVEAHKLGITGPDAIVWARTRSFLDPDTQRWNAPGLGNNIHTISRDQSRRANAIARAMTVKTLPSLPPEVDVSTAATHTPAENVDTAEPPEAIALLFDDFLMQAPATLLAAGLDLTQDSAKQAPQSSEATQPAEANTDLRSASASANQDQSLLPAFQAPTETITPTPTLPAKAPDIDAVPASETTANTPLSAAESTPHSPERTRAKAASSTSAVVQIAPAAIAPFSSPNVHQPINQERPDSNPASSPLSPSSHLPLTPQETHATPVNKTEAGEVETLLNQP
ncbi:MAG: hypothetical protein F6J95_008000 [Leptolyngbya sp. SIO1E4]|nr:hypothetical protein [Leptolyngbya sp. SIO1E4]